MELKDIDSKGTSKGSNDDNLAEQSSASLTRLPHSACIWPGVQDTNKFGATRHKNYLGDELISARRFTGLQNAANRARSKLDHFEYNNDDSILGDNTTVDLTDGVDLRAKRLEMSFDLLDAISLIFSMCSFCLDMMTDIAVACFHYLNNDYWYCALTVAFILIPTLVTSGISLRWYILDSYQEGQPPVSKTQWSIRLIFHILQIGPILRYYESLQYGLKFREAIDLDEKRKIYMKMIYEDADATMLRLFESFMESAPQLMLQMYIITKNYPFDDYEYWTSK